MTNPHAARNRLGDESSPYLLQHANNPVDWYPWGEEAIQRAVGENKPIFLSIGYSACHWCHVMEHESFEDPQIAEQLNTDFISIKVDREERPDLDQIYMQAVQLMTGRGGWPMSVFLAPNLKPFYGGTYWPPHPSRGMPGFEQVLAGVKDAWHNRQQQALDQADQLTSKIEETMAQADAGQAVTDDTIWQAAVQLERSFDRSDGGFGSAPKFPRSMDLQLLLRVWFRNGRSAALEMVKTTLDKMAAGGIYDHLGGGFARYSVDQRWLVPHFEKMLYDNALLTLAYLEAWQITRDPRYETVICETMRYIQRDMTDAEGGFHSTEDADSEGVEGKFYVWSLQEVEEILGGELADRFCYVYDVTAEGNFEGSNILNCPKTMDQVAAVKNWDLQELSDQLAGARQKLFAERQKRIRPAKDDKILVSWNGLMIDSMARAGLAFAEPSMLNSAVRAAEFIWSDMRSETGRLLHVWRHGRGKLDAFLDDYSCYANSLVTLFECTGDGKWLDRAVALCDTMIEQFWDGGKSGFFFTANDQEKLITRNKDYFDSSVPSGNSMSALVLMRLGKLTGSSQYLDIAGETVASSAAMLEKFPAAAGQMLLALDMQLGPTRELVVASTDSREIPGLISQIQQNYLPNRVVATYDGSPSSSHLSGLLEGKQADAQPKLYVCENFACQVPIVGHAEINDRFQKLAEPAAKPE